VFEANSVFTALEVVRFMSQAAGLTRAHYAQVLLIGGPALAAAIQADVELGHPTLRGGFQVVAAAAHTSKISPSEYELLANLVDTSPEGWSAEVLAIARRMKVLLGTNP
jgi:hypothetical protein